MADRTRAALGNPRGERFGQDVIAQRALTGYLMPTSGEIALLGERYGESDWRELRKRSGSPVRACGR